MTWPPSWTRPWNQPTYRCGSAIRARAVKPARAGAGSSNSGHWSRLGHSHRVALSSQPRTISVRAISAVISGSFLAARSRSRSIASWSPGEADSKAPISSRARPARCPVSITASVRTVSGPYDAPPVHPARRGQQADLLVVADRGRPPGRQRGDGADGHGRSRFDIKPTLTAILAGNRFPVPEAPDDRARPDRLHPHPGRPGRSGPPLGAAYHRGPDRRAPRSPTGSGCPSGPRPRTSCGLSAPSRPNAVPGPAGRDGGHRASSAGRPGRGPRRRRCARDVQTGRPVRRS